MDQPCPGSAKAAGPIERRRRGPQAATGILECVEGRETALADLVVDRGSHAVANASRPAAADPAGMAPRRRASR